MRLYPTIGQELQGALLGHGREAAHLTRFELVTFAFGGQRSRYAASRRTVLSINRKNRVLRAPQPPCSPLHYASLQQRRHLRPLSGVQEHRDVADKGLLVLILRAVIRVRIELRIGEMLL